MFNPAAVKFAPIFTLIAWWFAMGIQAILSDFVLAESYRAMKAVVEGDKVYFAENPGGATIGAVAGAATANIYAPGDPLADFVPNENQPSGEIRSQYDLKKPTGETELSVIVTNGVAGSAAQNAATLLTSEAMVADPVGKALLESLPEVSEGTFTTGEGLSTYLGSESYQKNAIEKARRQAKMPVEDDLAAEINRVLSPQDGSRVSKEYHEYVYCVHKAWYWADGIAFMSAPFDLSYSGPGANSRPTFGDWVDYPSLRQLFKIFRRYNRLAGGCGGKALYTEQGYADRKVAVRNYIVNADVAPDDVYQQALTTLKAASADFS